MQNKQQQPLIKKFKQSLFNLQFLMSKQKFKTHPFIGIIITILYTLPVLAILVQNSSYLPFKLYQILKYFLISEILSSINIKCETFQLVVFMFHILAIIFLIVFILNQQSNIFAKISLNFIETFKVLMIPIIQFEIHLFKNNQKISILLQITVGMTAILTFLTLAYVYLDFNCLRQKNSYWKFENKQQVYFYGINLLRVIMSIAFSFDFFYLTISLVFQFFKRQRKHYYTKISYIKQQISSHLIISLHVSLLLGNFTQNQSFCLEIFIVFGLISLIKGFFDCLKQLTQKSLELPLCESNSHQFYDYYFCLKEIIQRSHSSQQQAKKNKQKLQNILSVHKLNCKSNFCPIKNRYIKNKDDKLTQIKQFVKYKINENGIKSKENNFVKIVWDYQVQGNLEIMIKDKDLTIQQQFIVYTLQRQSKQIQRNDQMDKENENIQAKVVQFYFYLNEIMKQLSNFYTQIGKSQINVLDLISKTQSLKQNSQKLQIVYNILLKRKALTYKMAELYLYYKGQFLKNQIAVAQQQTNKALASHNNKNSNQIQEIHNPVLVLYPDTGNIQNFNMQFLALLKYNRTQLKTKNIEELSRPKINIRDPVERSKFISKAKKNKFFLIDANKKQICINLEISQRMINGIKLYFLVFKRQKINENKNYFLINKRFHIQNVLKQQSYFKKSKEQIILIKWRDMFQKSILPDKSQLMKHRIIKKRISECSDTLMIVTIEETIQQEYMMVGVTLVVDMIFRQNRVSIMVIPYSNQSIKIQANLQRQFAFYYLIKKNLQNNKNQKDETSIQEEKQLKKIYLCGSNDPNLRNNQFCKDILELNAYEKELNNKIVEHTLLKTNILTKNIKTYRLYDRQLYNIDLQDKQAYLSIFEKINDNDEQIRTKQGDSSALSFYMFLFVMLIVLVLIVFLGVWGFSTISHYFQIQSKLKKIDEIEIIRISLNQMNGILRDIQNGLYLKFNQDWKLDMNIALTKIQQTRTASKDLFTSNDLQMFYEDVSYVGSLNEVLDILLAKFHLLTNTQNHTMIPSIQNASIKYMVDFLRIQKQNYSKNIQNISGQLNSDSYDLTYSSLPLMIVFFLMMIKFFSIINESLNNKLIPFLKISDKEATYKAENAQKVIYFIQMISKNNELELKNILSQKNHFEMRKKRKNTTVGLKSKIMLIFALVCMVAGNITYLQVMRNNVYSHINQIQNLNKIGSALLEVYTQMASITNQYSFSNYLNTDQLQQIIDKMDIIQKNRQNYPFSKQNNQLFSKLFYDNICSPQINYLLFSNRSTNCWYPTPNFTIQNPYVIGIDYYLRRMHYNIVDNITDTYGSTGVFSFSFAIVFQYMAQRISQDSTIIIVEFQKEYHLKCLYLSLSYGLYILFILFLVLRHNGQLQKIKELANLLKIPHNLQNKKQQKSQMPPFSKGKAAKITIQRPSQNCQSIDKPKDGFIQKQEQIKLAVKMTQNKQLSRYRNM